jgi:hypothetical protein
MLARFREISQSGPASRAAALGETHRIADPVTRATVVGDAMDECLLPQTECLSYLAGSPNQEDLQTLAILAPTFEGPLAGFAVRQALILAHRRARGQTKSQIREALGGNERIPLSVAGISFWAWFLIGIVMNALVYAFTPQIDALDLAFVKVAFVVYNFPLYLVGFPPAGREFVTPVVVFAVMPLFWGGVGYCSGRFFLWNLLRHRPI